MVRSIESMKLGVQTEYLSEQNKSLVIARARNDSVFFLLIQVNKQGDKRTTVDISSVEKCVNQAMKLVE